MFTQKLTPQQERDLISALNALLATREQGIAVYARAWDIPDALAERIMEAETRGQSPNPQPGIRASDVVDTLQDLQCNTRGEQRRARRTLAAIIREEIRAGRLVPIFTSMTIFTEKGEIPKHVVVTALQAPGLTG